MFKKCYDLAFGNVDKADLYTLNARDTMGSGRPRRGTINNIFTTYNTASCVINSLDGIELQTQINSLKTQLRKILKQENTVVGSELHEDQAMTVHLKEIVAELEKHAQTVNALIREDRNASDQAAQNEVCVLYGAWLLGEGRNNLVDLKQGVVPSWIRNKHLAALYPYSNSLSPCQLRLASEAYPVPVDCGKSNHTIMGIILRMPVMGETAQPAPVYRVKNIEVIQGGAHIRFAAVPPYVIKWEHAVTGTDLSGCRSRGAHVILCPQYLSAHSKSQCGFKAAGAQPINCTMGVMAQNHVPAQVAYIGGGTYCVTTTNMDTSDVW
uniref:uncharacterized protein n=1 Tax=Pristiophorus japonicus TaxID=55135 RepID=UPI00398E4DEC